MLLVPPCHVADHDRRRCAGDARHVVVFGKPEPLIPPLLPRVARVPGSYGKRPRGRARRNRR